MQEERWFDCSFPDGSIVHVPAQDAFVAGFRARLMAWSVSDTWPKVTVKEGVCQ